MPRFAISSLALVSSLSLLGCVDPPCPEGSEATGSDRCVAVEAPDAERRFWPEGDGGADASPDDEERAYVVVEVPPTLQWVVAGQSAEISFGVATRPSYYGPLSVELVGLPEGISTAAGEDFAGPSFTIEAAHDAPVGAPIRVTVRATVDGRPDLEAEATFDLAVRAARGALDQSFDGDGIRTDVPLDGTRDRVTHVALAPEGTIVVAGDGRSDARRVGFVSWYTPEGAPDPAIAGGGSRLLEILGESNIRTRGVMPTADGLLVSVEAEHEHVLRLDREGNVDPRFGTDPAVARPDYLNGGAIHPHGDGFILHFNEQLERYHADGTLDRGFGEGGVVSTTGALVPQIAIFADGSIVRGTASHESGKVFTRFVSSGAPHLGFGSRGSITHAGLRSLQGLAGLEDGGFVVASNAVSFSPEYFAGSLTRMTADGSIDGDFGAAGEVAIDDGTGASFGVHGVAFHEESIYAWGVRYSVDEPDRGFVVAYDQVGRLDPSFGDEGFVDLGELVLPVAAVVDADAHRLILGCDRPLSSASDAARMIGVVRLWL